MAFAGSNKRQVYVYRHLSREQSLKLNELRTSIAELESTYTGQLLLTRAEYCLLLPLLNPLVIAQNSRQLKKLCNITQLPKNRLRKMKRNLWLQSAMGFVPVLNVVFTRKFKCNTRNLNILESQIQEEEDLIDFDKSMDHEGDGTLPTHITRLFDRCPAAKREQTASAVASSRQSRTTSLYYSPCVSISELRLVDFGIPESVKSKHSVVSTDSTAIESVDPDTCGVGGAYKNSDALDQATRAPPTRTERSWVSWGVAG
ncbi:hypothetical protein GGF46_003203 [Coemansia sp. RSA 552]|nr:hypothetical protein GGF46_003203 [Coemansia sp. RSA 552]